MKTEIYKKYLLKVLDEMEIKIKPYKADGDNISLDELKISSAYNQALIDVKSIINKHDNTNIGLK